MLNGESLLPSSYKRSFEAFEKGNWGSFTPQNVELFHPT